MDRTSEPAFDVWTRGNGWPMEMNLPTRGNSGNIGALTLYREASRPYEPGEIELAESLANYLTIAVQAHRLGVESKESAVRATTAEQERIAAERRSAELGKNLPHLPFEIVL